MPGRRKKTELSDKPTAPKRTTNQKQYDTDFCMEQFVRGHSYRVVTAKLNEHIAQRRERAILDEDFYAADRLNYVISHQQVYVDIQEELKRWQKENLGRVDEYITRDLLRLERMEDELWEAWEQSKQGKRKTKIKGGSIVGGQTTGGDIDERVLETTNGNPQYMEMIRKVMADRKALLNYAGFERRPEPPKPATPASQLPPELRQQVARTLTGVPTVVKDDTIGEE